jgi:hypothetical protein
VNDKINCKNPPKGTFCIYHSSLAQANHLSFFILFFMMCQQHHNRILPISKTNNSTIKAPAKLESGRGFATL